MNLLIIFEFSFFSLQQMSRVYFKSCKFYSFCFLSVSIPQDFDLYFGDVIRPLLAWSSGNHQCF